MTVPWESPPASPRAFNGQDVAPRSAAEGTLRVTREDGIAALERHAVDMDRFNDAAARPNPFMSSAHLCCYARHAEYHRPDHEERLYLIHEADRLVACAPMRRSVDRFGPGGGVPGLSGARLRWLAPLDTEQPGILCAPGYEARAARALLRHLIDCDHDWTMLDLVGQRLEGAVHRAAHELDDPRYRARDIAVEPYHELELKWSDLAAYLRSLPKKMRSNITRHARRLYAAGAPQLVLARGPAGAGPWLDAYCELEARSWKRGTPASITRDLRRLGYYREVLAGRAGLEPAFIGILLDGALIGALLTGDNAATVPGRHGCWLLETAYDNGCAQLGPGNLLLLLAAGEALARGGRQLHFMQNFAYYKHRWGATATEVVSVQLVRRSSLHGIRAMLGDARRRFRAARTRHAVSGAAVAAPSAESTEFATQRSLAGRRSAAAGDQRHARSLAAAALRAAGPAARVLDLDGARRYLPFELQQASGAEPKA